jgi:hypothetical protein
MRPCVCERVTSEVYDLDQCRLCWLYRFAPAYRELWDSETGSTPVPTPRERPADCIHLGRILDRLGRTCPGCWLRVCDLYERCVVGHEPPEGVRSCQDCLDYMSERSTEEKRPTTNNAD